MLTQDQISAIYAPKAAKIKTPTGVGKVFLADGWKVVVKRTDYDYGSFQGRVGTMRRSRKGRSSRNANGRRFYNDVDSNVIAYKLSPAR